MAEMQWRSRIRLVDEVVGVLRNRIYEGELSPGSPIRQERLAAELNVSRTPLREAFRMLEREGLVQVGPGHGHRVVSVDLPSLLAAYELREAIDGVAARLTARDASRSCSQQLASILHAQEIALDPWDPAEYTSANVAFHRTIIEASGNAYVVAQLPIVRMTSQVFTPVKLVDRPRAAAALVEHQAIAAAIADQQPNEAEQLAKAHIRRTIESLRVRLSGGETA